MNIISYLEPSLSEKLFDVIFDVYDVILETFGLSEYASERQPSRPSGGGKSKGKSRNLN